jgi:O-antigen ligase
VRHGFRVDQQMQHTASTAAHPLQQAAAPPLPAHGGVEGAAERNMLWVAAGMVVIVAVKVHEFLPQTAVLRPGLLLSAFATLMLFSSPRLRRAFEGRTPRLLGWYCVLAIVGVPFAFYPTLAVMTLQKLLPAALVAIVVMACSPTRRSLRTLLAVFVMSAALYAFLTVNFGHVNAAGRVQLVRGGSYDVNDSASIMAAAAVLGAGLFLTGRGMAKIAFGAAIPVVLTALAISGSRGGALALFGGIAAFVYATRGRMRSTVVTVSLAVLAATWVIGGADFQERMGTLRSVEDDYNLYADEGRKAVWTRGIGYIIRNPVFGVGIGNYSEAEGAYLAGQGRRGKWSSAHSAYIQSFAELGVPGGLVFLALLFGASRSAFRLQNHPDRDFRVLGAALFAGVWTFGVGGIFLSHAFIPFFFFIIGISALAESTMRRELGLGRSHLVNTPQRQVPRRVAPQRRTRAVQHR